MIKKTVLVLVAVATLANELTAAVSGPLAALSAATYLVGSIANIHQHRKPRRLRSNVGSALQAVGAAGLVTSAVLAVSELEPDVCSYHIQYPPAYRYLYPCCRGCRYYHPVMPCVVYTRHPAMRFSVRI